MDPQVDLIGGGKGTGQVASYLSTNGKLNIGAMKPFIDMSTGKSYVQAYMGGDPKKEESYKVYPLINTNATLRRDEWKALDEAVIGVARYRLNGIQDLINKGLVYNLGNAMGTTVLEWHDMSDPMEANISMDGITRGNGDRPSFQHNYLPIPIIHVDYEINARALEASRNMGNPLDVTSAESAARRVAEKLENMLFTNITYSFGEKDARNRNTIYSYVNHPDRSTLALGTHWDDLTEKVGETIINKVLEAKKMAISRNKYGPYTMYIPTNYETVLDKDYDMTTPGTTIRERILKISGIKEIKVVDSLAADNVLLVEMTPSTVRLIRGLGLQNIQWKEEANFVTKFKVLTIQVPQIRSDMNGKCGIVHMA